MLSETCMPSGSRKARRVALNVPACQGRRYALPFSALLDHHPTETGYIHTCSSASMDK